MRSGEREIMDAEDIDAAQLQHALDHLVVVNRLLNGYGPSLEGLQKLLPRGCRKFSLLDVGCGSGDTLREIAKWARRRGIECRLTGVELSPVTAELARTRCACYPEIEIRHRDLFSLGEDERFDVTHCALVLHHFSREADAADAMRQMLKLCGRGVIVNDLHRHWLAYGSIALLTRMLSRSPVLRNDAPLSVARAFTRKDLVALADAAGAEKIEIEWRWAFRWLMVLRRNESPGHDV